MQVLTTDVVVVGSGAGGGAVAGELWRSGLAVIVVEAGEDRFPGGMVHSRNLHPAVVDDPLAGAVIDREWIYPSGSRQPVQGLPGYRVSHGLGGMTALWTSNCPMPLEQEVHGSWHLRQLDSYFDRAMQLFSVSHTVNGASRRGQRILRTIDRGFERMVDERPVQHMPIAVDWRGGTPYYMSSGDLMVDQHGRRPPLLFNTRGMRLHHHVDRIESIDCITDRGDLLRLAASSYVLAAGSIAVPQLVHASGLDVGPALGRFATDHMIVTTQLTLAADLLAGVPDDDPMFSIWVPVSTSRPWQHEVFRHPQEPLPGRSPLEMADVCSFSRIVPRPDNRVTFSDGVLDGFGLPRPQVTFTLGDADLQEMHHMQDENIRIARMLSNPEDGMRSVVGQLGSAAHLMGTCRSGDVDDGSSVTDPDGRFWRMQNLYAAGLPVLGAATACNPTLTCVAYALRTADAIKSREGAR